MAIDTDVKIVINVSELVNIRASFLELDHDDLDTCDIENISNELRTSLTWDNLYYMIDQSILEYIGDSQNNYGQIANDAELVQREKNRKQFEIVKLKSHAWEIDVPRRIKK